MFPSSFYEVSVTLTPKLVITVKSKDRPISLMNMDAEIFNKILATYPATYKNDNAQWIGKIYPRNAVVIEHLTVSVIYYINREKGWKTRDHLNTFRIVIWQNWTFFHEKSNKLEIVRNFLNMKNSIYENPMLASYLMAKDWIISPQDQVRDKDVLSSHLYSTLHWRF